jgi:hypothetical protein
MYKGKYNECIQQQKKKMKYKKRDEKEKSKTDEYHLKAESMLTPTMQQEHGNGIKSCVLLSLPLNEADATFPLFGCAIVHVFVAIADPYDRWSIRAHARSINSAWL